jgi:hypothetical protein
MYSPHQVCAALLAVNANHAAIVPLNKKKKGEASAQQTTRIAIGNVGLTSSQQQCVVALTCGLAHGLARWRLGGSRARVSSPNCTFESTNEELLDPQHTDPVLFATTTESFFASTPLSTNERDLLNIMTKIASKELEYSLISNIVPQTTTHVRAACERVVGAKDGSRIWFSFALLVWMVHADVRLHRLLDEHGVYDFDYAIADALTRYGRIQIGNRARREYDEFSEVVKKLASLNKVDLNILNSSIDKSWDNEVVDRVVEAAPDLDMSEVAVVVQASQNTIKSRKSRRCTVSAEMPKAPSSKRICKGIEKASPELCEDDESRSVDNESTDATETRSDDAKAESSREQQDLQYTGAIEAPSLEIYFCHFMSTKTSEHSCSLKHIVSESKSATEGSARAVVTSQLKTSGVAATEEVLDLSMKAALHTREAAMNLLMQKECESPTIVRWKLSDYESSKQIEAVGINYRTRPPLFLIGHAPPDLFQPPSESRSRVAWCTLTMRPKTISSEKGRGSAYCHSSESASWRGWAIESEDGFELSEKRQTQGQRRADFWSNHPLPLQATGLARSVLTLRAKIPVSVDLLDCASEIADSVVNKATEAWDDAKPCEARGSAKFTTEALTSRLPRCFPSNTISCGMHVLESVRSMHSQTASHQSMVVVPLGAKCGKVLPLINPDDKPSALLMVHDVKFDARGDGAGGCVHTTSSVAGVKTVLPTAVAETECSVALALIGDCPMSIPTATRIAAGAFARRESREASWRSFERARSLLLFAGIQCHTVNEHGRVACSKEINKFIENTSKIKLPDNHRCPSSTIFQAYVVGHCNVPPQFAGTLWEGAYGASYDCGSIASIGFGAKHVTADDRLPVSAIHMPQQQVDELSEELAPFTLLSVNMSSGDDRAIVTTPSELWGLARAITPGVHHSAKYLVEAFESLRRESATSSHDTVLSIQALPFSPLTEAISPIVRHDQWTGFRHPCKRGSTFQADETMPEASIMNTPLLSACRSTMLNVASCIGENLYANVQVVEIACTQIGWYAKLLAALRSANFDETMDTVSYADAMEVLYDCVNSVYVGKRLEKWESCVAFDALVLFNACAPVQFEVGEHSILEVFAAAPSAARRGGGGARTIADVVAAAGLSAEDEATARRYWARLGDRSERGFWNETTELVRSVCEAAASFESGFEEITNAAHSLERWVRALWKLHSDDGIAPPGAWSPLCDLKSPASMAAADVLNVFVDRPKAPQTNRQRQRGALFGMANNGFNQLLSLLASAHVEGVVAQYARNEGNMCIRHSCCALKRGSDDKKPTSKSTSPVHSENDWEAFGTMEAKEDQARRQFKAWEINNKLVFEITKRIYYKHGVSGQDRGSVCNYNKCRQYTDDKAATGARAWNATVHGFDYLAQRAKAAWSQFPAT